MSDSVNSLPPPSPSQISSAVAAADSDEQNDPLAGVPPLTTYTATTEDDVVEALRLVADSVAQQRQFTSQSLIFHPVIVAIWVGLFAAVAQYFYHGHLMDWGFILTTYAGVVTAGLVIIRMATGEYLELAEKTGTWTWLGSPTDNEIIVTKFGDEMIGAIIVKFTKSDPSSPSKSSRKKGNSANKLRPVIRAWTVKQRYRHKGIGGGLLEEAVRLCKAKGTAATPAPVFADDHANSKRVLPNFFNSAMAKREKMARSMLEQVADEQGMVTEGAGGEKGKKKRS